MSMYTSTQTKRTYILIGNHLIVMELLDAMFLEGSVLTYVIGGNPFRLTLANEEEAQEYFKTLSDTILGVTK
jgi:hypothetical protein